MRRPCCRAVSHCAFFNSVQTSLHTTTLLWVCLLSLLPSHNNTTELQAADSHIIKCHTPLHNTALYGPAQWQDFTTVQHSTPTPPPGSTQLCHTTKQHNITLLYFRLINFYLRPLTHDIFCTKIVHFPTMANGNLQSNWFALHKF